MSVCKVDQQARLLLDDIYADCNCARTLRLLPELMGAEEVPHYVPHILGADQGSARLPVEVVLRAGYCLRSPDKSPPRWLPNRARVFRRKQAWL